MAFFIAIALALVAIVFHLDEYLSLQAVVAFLIGFFVSRVEDNKQIFDVWGRTSKHKL